MSEYQYYEFQALDRPLTEQEQDKIGALSSRVELTPTRASFTYNYGDFPGNAEKILARYYDAMLYVTNFGSRQMMFRFPSALVKAADWKPYCLKDAISLKTSGEHVVLDIRIEEEPGGEWVEGEGQLSPLLPLRQALLEQDLRSLYLAWLKCAQGLADLGEDIEQVQEPPVPPNLAKLTPPLRAWSDFLELDRALLKVAAQASPALSEPKPTDYESLLAQLPAAEREQFLLRLLRGEPNLTQQLKQRLLAFNSPLPRTKALASSPRRTVGELLAKADPSRSHH